MLKSYLNDTSGQFAIMFAGVATVLIVSAASAVDLVGLQKNKARLQALTDAAVLAVASSGSDNRGELIKIAKATVETNNNLGDKVKVQLSIDNDIIRIAGSDVYQTQLLGVIGIRDVPVNTISEAPLPREVPLNIALVLDRTGSMAGANLESLKSASSSLIDIFDSYDGEVRAAVVPFSDYVNVGLGNRNASWMNVPEDETIVTGDEVCRDKRDLINPDQCTTQSYTGTCSNGDGGGTYSCPKTKRTCPDSAYGPVYEFCSVPTQTVKWNGCAGSRDDNLNIVPAYRSKPIPGIMNVHCGQEVLPLTLNITEVKDKIDSLTASGSTYIPSGLIWGWRMLDSKQPFDDLTNSQDDRKRALVLMTDGSNTRSLNQPFHNGDDSDATDELTAELCDLIKKDRIDVFTVAYRLSDSEDTKDIIRECASTEAFFFDAANASELEEAFKEIGRSLYEVRLSR